MDDKIRLKITGPLVIKAYQPSSQETRRIVIVSRTPTREPTSISYRKLKDRIRETFKLPDTNFVLEYTDDEGDNILIKSSWELQEAVDNNRLKSSQDPATLKVTIIANPNLPQQPEPEPEPESESEPRQTQNRGAESTQKAVNDIVTASASMLINFLEQDSTQAILQSAIKSAASMFGIPEHTSRPDTSARYVPESDPSRSSDTSAKDVPESDVSSLRSVAQSAQSSIFCNRCFNPITGAGWACCECKDYDLCRACKGLEVGHDFIHTFRPIFIRIPTTPPQFPTKESPLPELPTDLPTELPTDSSSKFGYGCNVCHSEIVGIRHACTTCSGFDLCESCFKEAKHCHPMHTFITHIENSSEEVSDLKPSDDNRVLHDGIICDQCNNSIHGIRYKCGYCLDYDLCQVCEENSNHDSSHLFVKIRNPINLGKSDKPILSYCIEKCQEAFGDKSTETIFNSFQQITLEQPSIAASSASSVVSEQFSKGSLTPSGASIKISRTPSQLHEETSSQMETSQVVHEYEDEQTPRDEHNTDNDKEEVYEETVAETRDHSESGSQYTLSASFVADITIPDGSVALPGSQFLKIWKLKNDGTSAWPEGSQLVFSGGNIFRAYPSSCDPKSFVIPVTAPQQDAFIVAELQAPETPGRYISYFRLSSPDGIRFGHRLWCDIIVSDQSSTTIPPLSTSVISNMVFPAPSVTVSPTISYPASEFSSRVNSRAPSFSVADEEDFEFYPAVSSYPVASATSTISASSSTSARSSNHSNSTASQADSGADFVIITENAVAAERATSKIETPVPTNTPTGLFSTQKYNAQLTQIHEMGLTFCDELALRLLDKYQGNIDLVVPQILEKLYPE
ncbi:hypothetical protein CLU79DRAFT_886843 [Phycomyces nitens]|nr:hypothetical protein CLU79DRAFT_886843 [Phycomyces nitens]